MGWPRAASKIFAAKAVTITTAAGVRVQLHEQMAIHDVNNLIEFMALENYVRSGRAAICSVDLLCL